MNRKGIEDKFSRELDTYIEGTQNLSPTDTQEYNELLELGKLLADKNFSEVSNKNIVLNKVLENSNHNNEGEQLMKNPNRTRKLAISVASILTVCVMSISFMKTSFAQDLTEKIVKTFSLKHVSVVQMEPPKTETVTVPSNLKGKIFDKDGKIIVEVSTSKREKFYTSTGEEIVNFVNNEPVTAAQQEKLDKDAKAGLLELKDPSEINKHTCFKVILPTYLPEGYKFTKATIYKDKDKADVVDSKYAELYFTNGKTGKEIFMQQRFACEETATESGTDGTIEKVKVNDNDAILSDGTSLDWEANDTIYFMVGKALDKNELIKIAESIK